MPRASSKKKTLNVNWVGISDKELNFSVRVETNGKIIIKELKSDIKFQFKVASIFFDADYDTEITRWK